MQFLSLRFPVITPTHSLFHLQQVAEMTILPKGELAGGDNASKMIKAESKKNAYFFDYEAQTPGQPLVRLIAFCL